MKSSITDVPFFDRWLREKKFLAESSIYVYVECLKKFLETDPDIDNIEAYNKFIIKYSIKKRNSHYYSILRNFIEFKIENKKDRERLNEGMIRPPIRNDIKVERKYLKEEKILEVINCLKKEKHRVIALIQNLTGVRAGDIYFLREGQIVPEEYEGKAVLRLNITGKGKKRNVVFLHDPIAQKIVMKYILSNPGWNEYYFIEKGPNKYRPGDFSSSYKMKSMNYRWYWEDMKQALNSAGVDRSVFATHDLRRCFARRVWEKYKDVHVLQGLLNHQRADTTLGYLKQSGLKNIDYLKDLQTS